MKRKTVVGNLINFRGLVYAPINEQGVVFLFGKVAHEFGMYVELIRTGYPDCIAKRFIGMDKWDIQIHSPHLPHVLGYLITFGMLLKHKEESAIMLIRHFEILGLC